MFDILIIDDKDSWWQLIQETFCDIYNCDIATSYDQAKEKIKSNKYGAICLNFKFRSRNIGRKLLTMLSTHFPHVPVVLVTGNLEGSVSRIQKKYLNIKEVIIKGAEKTADGESQFIKDLLDTMPNIISPSNHTIMNNPWEDWGWKSADGEFVIPKGVIRDILTGIGNTFLGKNFIHCDRDELCQLAHAKEDRRSYFAASIWKNVWKTESGLPYLPLIDDLGKFEFSQSGKYNEYRDHIVHSVWVYFLGVCIYCQNARIRKAIKEKNIDEENFFRIWKITSLFHDIGYTCDVGIDHEEEFLSPIIRSLYKFIKLPLKEYFRPRNLTLSEDDEEKLARLSGRHTPFKLSLDDIEETSIGENYQILSIIEHLAISTNLAQNGVTTPLSNYYDMCKDQKPKKRDRFRDHGILSSLILLHQFHRFDHILNLLKKTDLAKNMPNSIARDTQIAIKNIVDIPITERYKEIVKISASAIALHNVDIDMWDPEKAKKAPYYLSLYDYKIDLDENPIAFLLALCDVLQCWDRPKRRYVDDPKDLSVPSEFVNIIFKDDIIHWSIKEDPQKKRQMVSPTHQIKQMSKYLFVKDKNGLLSLVKEF